MASGYEAIALVRLAIAKDFRNKRLVLKIASLKTTLSKTMCSLGASVFGLLPVTGLGTTNLLGMSLFSPRWEPVEGLELASVDLRPNWESAWIRDTIANDPAANAIVSGYVSGLTASGYLADEQGVWVASGIYPVAQHRGDTPGPAASLTKVATTLAALSAWDPDHRFNTLVGFRGELVDGIVNGDLVVEGGDDPLFVWEEAIALGNSLQQLGIRGVTGDLIIAGNFTMNFEPDPGKSGLMLKQALNEAEWDYEIEEAYQNFPPGLARPSIQIAGRVKQDPSSWRNQANGWIVQHSSLPLVAVLKAMNIYSNNAMAQQIADTLGGSAAVMNQVELAAGIAPGEIRLINGSGLGEENQMSPRAAVAMFRQIQDELRPSDYTVSDIFPIAGADGGTLQDRGLPNNAVVKTGSLAVVSALAGALPTRDKGIVWFSLINYGSGLDNLRNRQDRVLAALEQQWGRAEGVPPELQTSVRIGEAPYQFGDSRRNQQILQPQAMANADE